MRRIQLNPVYTFSADAASTKPGVRFRTSFYLGAGTGRHLTLP
jgi:hypothetical protein